MSVHPYRQKTGAAAPYPVEDFHQAAMFQPSPRNSPRHSPGQARSPQHRPLDESVQHNRMVASMASPRFSSSKLNSSESLASEIPDITHQLSQSRLADTPEPGPSTLSTSSIPQPAHHRATGSHGSSVASYPAATSPSFNHNRSVSSTSSLYHDRNESMSVLDLNQNIIQQFLGASGSHLVPRMETIDMYRKNAKKSSDPAVLFQYAQYMLQTALLLDSSSGSAGTKSSNGSDSASTSPLRGPESSKPQASSSNAGEQAGSEGSLKASLLKESFHYLKRLADKGYVEAQYFLGDAFSSGAFGKVDNKEAFNLFLAAAKHGHTECAFRTAHCYEEGLGTGRDARKGVDFLKMAASKNHPAAMYKLGIYFFYGRMGVSDSQVNKKLGIKWLERASDVATELTSAAPYELGKLYYSGFSDILIKDQKYALELYAHAAALGHIEASAALGHHYEVGDIVTADPSLSIHYYTKAALGGHAQSMLAMCAWYMVGSEPYFPKDEHEAFEWAKRAAACNHGKAQFVLANFYEKGIGCDKNAHESQQWYIKAAENGQEKALSRIRDQQLVAKLTKKLKKSKKSSTSASSEDTAPQDKDCIIM